MTETSFGANIIEILTDGMYQDSKVIYREYIQNACDQIDKAEQLGILNTRNIDSYYPDLGQGEVNIWRDPEKRYISIEDNATGIKAEHFQRTLLNVANSDKIMGKDKGFRGIGRLCGLAYCKTLVFTSRWIDEPIISIMRCNAEKMFEMITEANTNVKMHSAIDVLNEITEFSTRPANDSDPKHFFKVELIDINKENGELFGDDVADYLSFVAPVPYDANFIYRSEIYAHVKQFNLKIDEYKIRINGEQIFKKYKKHLKTGNGQDEVFGVKFHNFMVGDSIVGWIWFGETNFIAAIKDEEISRGLRLRKENIQIGDNNILRDLFTRDKRGNSYFIGEMFAVSPQLIPNSRRDYFNENLTRVNFENMLKDYFNSVLYYIYYEGSDINSSLKKINLYEKSIAIFEEKVAEGFLTPKEHEREERELEAKAQEAEKAKKNLEKKRESGRSILTSEIIERRSKDIPVTVDIKTLNHTSVTSQEENTVSINKDIISKNSSKKSLIDTMFPELSKSERKLLLEMIDKILSIIRESTDKKVAENIINSIKEELK